MTINQLLAYEVEQLEAMSEEELCIALADALKIEPQPSADYQEITEEQEEQENHPKTKKKRSKQSLKETLAAEMKEMGLDLDDL